MEFLKIFALVVFFAGAGSGATGLLPFPVAVVAAVGLLGLTVHHHRNRSLA